LNQLIKLTIYIHIIHIIIQIAEIIIIFILWPALVSLVLHLRGLVHHGLHWRRPEVVVVFVYPPPFDGRGGEAMWDPVSEKLL